MENTVGKTILSIELTPNGDTVNNRTQIEGAGDDLAIAYAKLSIALLKQYEKAHGKEFARAVYAAVQRQVIKETCLKESYEEHEKMFNRIRPLMNIMGKTFKAPKKEEAE